MPTTPAKRRAPSKKAAPLPENRTESEIVADALLARYNDLAPSLTASWAPASARPDGSTPSPSFQDSLGVAGDPMRDPANAIAAGRLHDHPVDAPDAAGSYDQSEPRCIRLGGRTAATFDGLPSEASRSRTAKRSGERPRSPNQRRWTQRPRTWRGRACGCGRGRGAGAPRSMRISR